MPGQPVRPMITPTTRPQVPRQAPTPMRSPQVRQPARPMSR
jgi:hypothetical protein